MLKSFKIYTCTNGALGLHLSRAPWDPYPWVSSIQKDSTAYVAGLRIGDCLLELNGQDVLGLKISEIAALLKNHWLNESSNYVTVVMWRNKCNTNNEGGTVEAAIDAAHDDDDEEDEENNAHNINQQSLQKFATCLQHIAQLLECPVCLEVIKPPGWQCCNGHVLCNNCRSRSEKCPVCRVPLGPRGRCLLSDKLFTLLADSFPCDGVRSNKNSPKDRRKCTTDFHNQPKMAILQKQQQQQQQQQQAKDFKKIQQNFILTTSSARRRLKTCSSKMQEEKEEHEVKEANKHTAQHPSMEQTMNDTNFVVNINKGNNSLGNSKKSSQDYSDVATALRPTAGFTGCKDVAVAAVFGNDELLGQTATTTTIHQCHCITCYKSDKVEIVNNVTTTATTTTLNKYILQIPTQQQQDGQSCLVQQQHQHHQQHRQPKEKYQNYQCPTGKLCCLTKKKNVMPSAAQTTMTTTKNTTSTTTSTLTNNKLSTKQTNAESTKSSNAEGQQRQQQQQRLQDEEYNFHKTLKNEWEVLAHLTEDHQIPVNQYYAEYGQRIAVHCDRQQKTITCINLKGNNSQIEKFLLASIPIEMTEQHSSNNPATTTNKVAIFIYHMNTLSTTSAISLDDDEVSNFETIIENPLTGIKWYGRAHRLTTPWSQIYHKQHFLMHDVLENVAGASAGAGAVGSGSGVNDAFVIVIKTKL